MLQKNGLPWGWEFLSLEKQEIWLDQNASAEDKYDIEEEAQERIRNDIFLDNARERKGRIDYFGGVSAIDLRFTTDVPHEFQSPE
ncbi:MAG: hypothetical protein LBN07_04755 [Christensenellaceae bacterium]|nr:hypothetical protein [Christensenellaceae bacterium]